MGNGTELDGGPSLTVYWTVFTTEVCEIGWCVDHRPQSPPPISPSLSLPPAHLLVELVWSGVLW